MVANCSYTQSRERDRHYTGTVKPSAFAGEGCCSSWINAGHRYGPVARFLPFDAMKNSDWLEPEVAIHGWFDDITLNGISSPDIHGLNHYFRDPLLHIPFFQKVNNVIFTPKEVTDAVGRHYTETVRGQFKTLETMVGFLYSAYFEPKSNAVLLYHIPRISRTTDIGLYASRQPPYHS